MPWYKDGAVYVTLGSPTVTGTNTAFAANARVGDAFCGPDGDWYEITNIASNTVISISPNYRGASSGGYYVIAPLQGYVKDLADAFRSINNLWGSKLAALGTTGNYEILPVAKGGTGGADQAGARTGLGLGAVAIESTVPVAKGGTGGTSQATARTGLGLGTAATLAAGSIPGQVMLAGDLNSPNATTINTYGNTFQTWTASTAGAPESSTQGTIINLGYNSPTYGSQILMSFTGEMYFRSGTYSTAIMRKVYHTGNTSRASDGTLKAL